MTDVDRRSGMCQLGRHRLCDQHHAALALAGQPCGCDCHHDRLDLDQPADTTSGAA